MLDCMLAINQSINQSINLYIGINTYFQRLLELFHLNIIVGDFRKNVKKSFSNCMCFL